MIALHRIAGDLVANGFDVDSEVYDAHSFAVHVGQYTVVHVYDNGNVTIDTRIPNEKVPSGLIPAASSSAWEALGIIARHMSPPDWHQPAYGAPLIEAAQ